MKNKKAPALVNLAIYTTITVFLWIFFDVYRALKKPAIIDIEPKILEPINPNLDNNLLNEVKNSIYFDKSLLQNIDLNLNNQPVSTESGEVNE